MGRAVLHFLRAGVFYPLRTGMHYIWLWSAGMPPVPQRILSPGSQAVLFTDTQRILSAGTKGELQRHPKTELPASSQGVLQYCTTRELPACTKAELPYCS